jgi:hypothetical protein
MGRATFLAVFDFDNKSLPLKANELLSKEVKKMRRTILRSSDFDLIKAKCIVLGF